MSELSFNCNDVEDMDVFEPMPDGTQAISEIIESDYTGPNEKGTRQAMVRFEVIDGEYQGHKAYRYMTMVCPSSKVNKNGQNLAELIGSNELREVCEACGKASITQTEELHGIPVLVTYGRDLPNAKGQIFNNVKSVNSYGGRFKEVAKVDPEAKVQMQDTKIPPHATPANDNLPF